MVIFYKIYKNGNEIQLTKNKMDLNNRNMKSSPPPCFIVCIQSQDETPRLGVSVILECYFISRSCSFVPANVIDKNILKSIYCHSFLIQYKVICLYNAYKINF